METFLISSVPSRNSLTTIYAKPEVAAGDIPFRIIVQEKIVEKLLTIDLFYNTRDLDIKTLSVFNGDISLTYGENSGKVYSYVSKLEGISNYRNAIEVLNHELLKNRHDYRYLKNISYSLDMIAKVFSRLVNPREYSTRKGFRTFLK